MDRSRRVVLKGAGASGALAVALAAGLLKPGSALAAWNKGAFDAKTTADAMKALGVANAAESKDIQIRAPEIAENGAVVPVTVSSALPGTREILLLVNVNPEPLALRFAVPAGTEPFVATRIRMAATGTVYAAVRTDQGF